MHTRVHVKFIQQRARTQTRRVKALYQVDGRGADRVVAARVIFTSAGVILSIKAKRTAAHHNSQQAGSTTAVQSSSSSEAAGVAKRDVRAGTKKERQ